MKLRKVKWNNHPILGDLELNFVNPEKNEPYETIILAGENVTGKTTILETIHSFLNLGSITPFEYIEYQIDEGVYRAMPTEDGFYGNYFTIRNMQTGKDRKIETDRYNNGNFELLKSETSSDELKYLAENTYFLPFVSKKNKFANRIAQAAIQDANFIDPPQVNLYKMSSDKRGFFDGADVNINLKKIPNNFEAEIIADSSTFLREFMKYLKPLKDYTNWYNKITLLKAENSNSNCIQSSHVLQTIYEYTKMFEPVVVTDVGQHQMLTAQYFNFNKPKKFITSGGLGTMGFGLPASIGAYLANPGSLVLNITGDGSFQMNLQELATCREHNIPVKIIIMNNNYLGMVRQMQEKIYNNMYQVEMINPDFTKIAEAYDLFAVRVKAENELIPALEKAISHTGTAIVDIAINSFEEI